MESGNGLIVEDQGVGQRVTVSRWGIFPKAGAQS